MTLYLVALHRPDDYDPALVEDEAMRRDIDMLNRRMTDAGVRVFVGGLRPPNRAVSLEALSDGEVRVTEGPYLKTSEHVGGFWVLEVDDLDEAVDWGRQAAMACRAHVEVRPFH